MAAKTILTFYKMKCEACDWYMNFKGGNHWLMFQTCNHGKCSQCGGTTKVVEISPQDFKNKWTPPC